MKGNPRYALVRVDGTTYCPSRYEKINRAFVCSGLPHCYKCKYGDTKQQLINKIAQVLFKEELGWYAEYVEIIPKGKIDEPFCRNIYEHCLDKARKIIEFMGVK